MRVCIVDAKAVFCCVPADSPVPSTVITDHDLISVLYDLQWPENRLEECYLEKNRRCIFVVHENAAAGNNENPSIAVRKRNPVLL
jgi:hypothetical protein